jgi:hypothetical protein
MRSFFLASIVLIGVPAAAQEQTRVAGYETYAVVGPATGEADALPFAQRHSATYNRFAHFRRMDGTRAIFDCAPEQPRKQQPATARGIY